jgi:hypothetical protein
MGTVLLRTRRESRICRPVLYLQSSYPAEFSFVVGNHDQARRPGVRGNPQVVVAHHPPFDSGAARIAP